VPKFPACPSDEKNNASAKVFRSLALSVVLKDAPASAISGTFSLSMTT
jgi:hypothetical protein